ncbi:MAG: PhzF family phenazine biosynthesis protein [Dehalococcoidia bacterium]
MRTIRHVDAFTTVPLEGNPAAVVDGEDLSTDVMQRIALNQHLSETVFLLPPEDPSNHARLRIFTPDTELPFAGHPTLASAHVLVSEGRVSLAVGEALRLETGAGVIPVEIGAGEPPRYTMTQARPAFRDATETREEIAAWIGLRPEDVVHAEHVSTGLFWLLAQISSLDAMMRVQPDFGALAGKEISIFCIGAEQPDAQVHVRTFAPGAGVTEDPVTGSSNGCIGALIARLGLLPQREGVIEYVAEQGIEMKMPGRVFVRLTGTGDEMQVQVGGYAVTVLRGELLLPG